ncbi:transglutaminase-like domain-containing protein [Halosquirtibacter laminarini]|uniref:Transglutaminase-like domain-containing protein n=1 Tax=Halosquirtibacter laminarini TaxID=3374600 RepID=A0AC61NPY9_9BACT|nr:transglutaminase-like domain-containing protein [Prolixibacteraceae bacterium]
MKSKIDTLSSDAIEDVAMLVDREISKQFKYDKRYGLYPKDMTYQEMQLHKGGTCTHCAALGAMSMRSVGIPCSIDFIPAWGNNNSRHEWNAIKIGPEKWEPYNLGEFGSGVPFYFKAPKVLRKQFSVNKNILSETDGYKRPGFLLIPNFKDVTKNYIECTDIIISPNKEHKGLPVISVWNNNDWRIVWYGSKTKEGVKYKNMGKEILYMPQVFMTYQSAPMDSPFYIDKDNTMFSFTADSLKTDTIKDLIVWRWHWLLYRENITKHKAYNLLMWDNGWKCIARTTPDIYRNNNKIQSNILSSDSLCEKNSLQYKLNFNNVPRNALFKLAEPNQRPFFVKNGNVFYL